IAVAASLSIFARCRSIDTSGESKPPGPSYYPFSIETFFGEHRLIPLRSQLSEPDKRLSIDRVFGFWRDESAQVEPRDGVCSRCSLHLHLTRTRSATGGAC